MSAPENPSPGRRPDQSLNNGLEKSLDQNLDKGLDAQTHEQKLQAMLSALWDRSRQTVAERAALLQQAARLLFQDRLDQATQLQAVDSAHKLAGVLGTFGLPRGTELAREAEILFGQATRPGSAEVERLQILMAELVRMIEIGPMGPR